MMLLNIKLFFMNTNNFLGQIISMFTVMYYTIILLIRSWKLMFVVALQSSLLLAWFLPTMKHMSNCSNYLEHG